MIDNVKCIIHGSFRKHYDIIKQIAEKFSAAGIEVIAPLISEIVGESNGFVHLANDPSGDPRVTELLYLKNLLNLGANGFSYYVNPEGTLGTSSSYEFGIDQMINTRCLFMNPLKDHPAYIPKNSIWQPAELIEYIAENGHYPLEIIPQNEKYIYRMVQNLILPSSVIAVGGIIVDYSDKKQYKKNEERDILLVETHKWSGKFSMVGGKVNINEKLNSALTREILEQTDLQARVLESICAFNELETDLYFKFERFEKIFVDNVVAVSERNVRLNPEAEDHIWIPPNCALKDLDLEPNARKTLEIYVKHHKRAA